MAPAADMIVKSPDDKTQLVVEAKKKSPATPEWAAQLRRNLYSHSSVPHAPYFLLALPERFYLWKNAEPTSMVRPDYEIDAQQALQPYLNGLAEPLKQLSEASFELLIRTWLEALLVSDRNPSNAPEWLSASGLFDAIKNGTVFTS